MLTHIEIVIALNHGIGDELSFFGPLISALLRNTQASIFIQTFHPSLYDHSRIIASDWRTEPIQKYSPRICDLGFYWGSKKNNLLPIEFDRSPLAFEACRNLGWTILAGESVNEDKLHESLYAYARHIIVAMKLTYPIPPWDFLPISKNFYIKQYVLLNLVGKGDAQKGLLPESSWKVVENIVRSTPKTNFVIVHLENEGLCDIPPHIYKFQNLKIHHLPFGSSLATKLYCNASLIITAEGGGYHIAYGTNTCALLVTSTDWFAAIQNYALPPTFFNIILFQKNKLTPIKLQEISTKIKAWIALMMP